MATEKTFKISQLKDVENLDGNDLFLVTDIENNKPYTRKVTLDKLQKVLEKAIVDDPSLMEILLDDDGKLVEKVDKKVDDKVKSIQTIDGGNAYGEN